MNSIELDRNTCIAVLHYTANLKRIAEARRTRLRADRIWIIRKQISGLKQPKNDKIIINRGIDCYV